MHLSKSIEYTPRVNVNVNYEFRVTGMSQFSFLYCNKCATLRQDADSGRGYACMRARDIWEPFVHSAQFFCEPKTALKIKVWDFPIGPVVGTLCFQCR